MLTTVRLTASRANGGRTRSRRSSAPLRRHLAQRNSHLLSLRHAPQNHDGTYLSEPRAGSRIGELHYLGDHPSKPQWINGAMRAIISRRLDVELSMPRYIPKLLAALHVSNPARPVNNPAIYTPPVCIRPGSVC